MDNTSSKPHQNPVKVIAGNHAFVRSQLEKSQKELATKKELLKELERQVYISKGNLEIVEANLRGINEALFYAQNSLKDKEEEHEELVKELVGVRLKHEQGEEHYKTLESKYMDFQVEKVIRKDQVVLFDNAVNEDEQSRLEFEELKKTVEKYEKYKEALDNGDEYLNRIQSGDMEVELEMRKEGIRDAFAKRSARVESVYLEIDEKNEAIKKLNQTILVREKQNQARLRKMQRELADKEATESHLQQTVEYLDRQIDQAVGRNGNATTNNNRASFPQNSLNTSGNFRK